MDGVLRMSTSYVGIGPRFTRKQLEKAVEENKTEWAAEVREPVQDAPGFEYALVVDGNWLWVFEDPKSMGFARYGANDGSPCVEFLEQNMGLRIYSEHEDEFWEHVEQE